MSWDEFLKLGEAFNGTVEASKDIHRPLFRAYTSGSTGPSKQVIHSAHTMVGNIHQMNFYGTSGEFRPTWMVTQLPPTLVAVVAAMILMPLASNKLLILCPFVDPMDVDLEMMRYRPNCWPLIPMFIENVMRNGRVPDDYDMSHLISAGAGSEAYNNQQLKRAQKFLEDHNCKACFTTGYGCSEAGSNMTLPMTKQPIGDGNVGIPVPLTLISIFKPGTEEELTYNTFGEICQSGPGTMIGYDNPEATKKAIKVHADGKRWLHTGDIGYMKEDGTVYALTRGSAPRYGGGDLATLPMENRLADAQIPGIDDEFFVIVPDPDHLWCFLPYLFVVLKEGYGVEDIKDQVMESLEEYMQPYKSFRYRNVRFSTIKPIVLDLDEKLWKENLKKMKRGKFSGWGVLAAMFFFSFFATAIYSNCLSLYMHPVCNDLNLSSTTPWSMINLIAAFTSAAGAIVIAGFYQKKNWKVCMLICIIGSGILFALASICTAIWQFYIIFAISNLFLAGLTQLPVSMLITAWFEDKRSIAMSIAFCGSSIGTAIWSPILSKMIASGNGGYLLSIYSIVVLVSMLLGGFFMDKVGISNTVLAASTLVILGMLSLAFSQADKKFAWGYCVFFGLSMCLPRLLPSVLTSTVFGTKEYAGIYAFLNLFFLIGAALGSVLTSIVQGIFGYQITWVLYAVFAAMLYICVKAALAAGEKLRKKYPLGETI